MASTTAGLEPFEIAVSSDLLEDLSRRLYAARLSADDTDDWDAGVNLVYLRELVDYWRDDFDWRAAGGGAQPLPQFRAEIDGRGIHFIHERGRGPAPLPLAADARLPGFVPAVLKLIPLLTDPAAHGGDAADAFDVVVPSLPGYGFSEPPDRRRRHVRLRRPLAHADDRDARLRALRRARRRLGQHGHRAARPQPRRRRSSAST